MAKGSKFPKTLWITREDEGTRAEYLSAHTSPDDVASVRAEIRAGMYQFIEEVTITAQVNVRPGKER